LVGFGDRLANECRAGETTLRHDDDNVKKKPSLPVLFKTRKLKTSR
jgi:hypothetical protein